jgi:hypothetical protein
MKTGIVLERGFDYLDFPLSVAKVDKRNKCLLYLDAKHVTLVLMVSLARPKLPPTV